MRVRHDSHDPANAQLAQAGMRDVLVVVRTDGALLINA